MKIKLTAPKPRNPLVAAARLRVAGAHGPRAGARRARSRRALQREVNDLRAAERHRPSL